MFTGDRRGRPTHGYTQPVEYGARGNGMTSGSRIHIQWTHTFFVWPSLLAAALSCVLVGFALQRSSPGQAPFHGLTRGDALSSSASSAASAPTPAALRGPLSRAVGAADRDYAISAAGDGFHGETAGRRIRANLSRSGVTVSSGSTWLKLSPRAIATGASSRRLAAVTPSAKGNRIDYARAGVDEWYVNGPLGLEQGFTVSRAAAGDASRHLALSLAISGDVRPSLSADGTAIELAHRGGPSLRYGELSAHDASGRALTSRLALHGATVKIEVDTSGAGYPVTIDPLIGQGEERPLPIDESEAGRFGFSIALSADGTTALVGAPADNGVAGAAWVFTRVGSTWTQQGPKLTVNEATDAEEDELCVAEANECGFGRSVALSARWEYGAGRRAAHKRSSGCGVGLHPLWIDVVAIRRKAHRWRRSHEPWELRAKRGALRRRRYGAGRRSARQGRTRRGMGLRTLRVGLPRAGLAADRSRRARHQLLRAQRRAFLRRLGGAGRRPRRRPLRRRRVGARTRRRRTCDAG